MQWRTWGGEVTCFFAHLPFLASGMFLNEVIPGAGGVAWGCRKGGGSTCGTVTSPRPDMI